MSNDNAVTAITWLVVALPVSTLVGMLVGLWMGGREAERKARLDIASQCRTWAVLVMAGHPEWCRRTPAEVLRRAARIIEGREAIAGARVPPPFPPNRVIREGESAPRPEPAFTKGGQV